MLKYSEGNMVYNQSDRNRFDRAWKYVIECQPRLFIEIFLPELSKKIDFSRKINFLSTELDTISKDSKTKDQKADEILEVQLKNGCEMGILVHVEVQNYYDKNFDRRMFSYYYRIFDKYDGNVVSLAILTDLDDNFWYLLNKI